jgi:hypothetical protein
MKVIEAEELCKSVKHVAVRYWWIREIVDQGIMRLEYVKSEVTGWAKAESIAGTGMLSSWLYKLDITGEYWKSLGSCASW